MKIGVIGAGYWGRKHVQEYNNLGHQVIVFDLLKENLEWCKKECNAIAVGDYHDILNDKDIEYVSICTPNSLHFKMGKEALDSKKNVLIEKPLSQNSKLAEDLFHVAKQNNLILLTGHIFRFNNAIKQAKELIESGGIGCVYHVRCDWHQMNSTTNYRDENIVLDIGLHPLDIVYYLFNTVPEKMNCLRWSFTQKFAEIANLSFELSLSKTNKISVIIDLNWITPIRNRTMTIIGSKKTIEVMCVKQEVRVINNKTEESKLLEIVPNNTLRDELNYFLSCTNDDLLKNNEKPNGVVAANVIRMIEMASIPYV